MLLVKMNFFGVILLVSLFFGINGDFGIIKEQKEIASRPQLENNFDKTLSESVITTAITVDDEKFDDNELGKVLVQNFKLYENLERERNKNGALGTVRKTRGATNYTSMSKMECISCFANLILAPHHECLSGMTSEKFKCSEAEQCFTELHPDYIKRGCLMQGRGNRTFYCKCPLCNDKPSYDNTHYEYLTYDDWIYDNLFLQTPFKSIDLMCKVCETNGTNEVADQICRLGKSTDSMTCGHNQLCYINIDDEIGHVSRGCMSPPVYNSIYYFCNKSFCNDFKHVNPNLSMKKYLGLARKTVLTAMRGNAQNTNLNLHLNLILLGQICIFFKLFQFV